MLDDSKLDAITLPANVLESSQSLKSDLNETEERMSDGNESSLPGCESKKGTDLQTECECIDHDGKTLEVSSEIESMPNIPSACSSNKETTCEGDTTLSANSPTKGIYIYIHFHL